MTLYSPKDVAGIINVTVVTLCHWRKKNVGPDWVRHGPLVFYPAGDLRAYIDRIGPIPANMTGREKSLFFATAHAPTDKPDAATIEELAARLAAVEKALVKIKMDERAKPKRKRIDIRRRKYRKRRTAPVIPY